MTKRLGSIVQDRAAGRRASSLWVRTLSAVVGGAALAGLVVGIVALDRREDRSRAMYHDVILMAGPQYDLLESGRAGVELSVDAASDPVAVGEESFTLLPGVEIVVEQRGELYCVMRRNQHGDETRWLCVDGTGDRPELGTLADEFG